eukprot:6891638-Pyramimonas_sp.AAC.1
MLSVAGLAPHLDVQKWPKFSSEPAHATAPRHLNGRGRVRMVGWISGASMAMMFSSVQQTCG